MNKMKLLLIQFACLILFVNASHAQLSGYYTIGGDDPDYTNFENAINALNVQGAGSEGVIFLVRSGTYDENPYLSITDINTDGESFVIFRPDTNAEVIVNFNIPDFGWGFRIQNSQNIQFNGIPFNAQDSTLQNMTINGFRINQEDQFFTVYISNGSENSGFKNIVITHEDNIDRIGFSLPVYISTYQVQSPETGMKDLYITNCLIIGGNTYGIFIDGDPDKKVLNTRITKNEIRDFARFGVYLQSNADSTRIDGNEIYQTIMGRSAVYGIGIGGSNHYTTIANNYIHSLIPTELAGLRGIQINSGATNKLIYNNSIYVIPAETNNVSYGLYILGGDNANNRIYHNSIYIGGVTTRNVSSHALRVSKDFSNDVLVNNILVNERTGGTANHYALTLRAITFMESDHNFLSVMSDDPDDNRFIARIGVGANAVDYNTLDDLLNAPGYAPRDQNSLTGDPEWNFPDLNIPETSPVIGQGSPVTFITTDILGNPRDPLNPDIGAYEYQQPLPCLPPAELFVLEVNTTTATLNWSAQGNEDSWDLIWGFEGFDVETDGELTEGIIEKPVILDNLQPGTYYQFYVRTLCDEVVTEWSDPATFLTQNIFYTIVATAGANGVIEPAGEIEVESGEDQSFTIIPLPGFKVSDVLIDEQSIGPVESYLFENVMQNHSIHALFEPMTYVLTFNVKDIDNQSVINAVISLNEYVGEPGEYVFTNLIPDEYAFVISLHGYFDESGIVEIIDQDVEIDVILITDNTGIFHATDYSSVVYPNPVQNVLKIESSGNIQSIRITNILGKIVYFNNTSENFSQLDLSKLESGIYIVEILFADGKSIHKILKD